MNYWKVLLLLAFTTILLSGCMYPDAEKAEYQVPAQDQLDAVQKAVDQFKEDTGVLPIKTRDQDTDIFIKYLIDFEKLVPQYMSKAPTNAYEQGGLFQYMIWDPENHPTVKLVDLRMPDKIRDVKSRFLVKEYPQYKDQLADYVYTINFENLGYSEDITVDSPYSSNQLPLIVSAEGEVYVDYSVDLNAILQEEDAHPTPGEDIRYLLVDKYPVVPAYSLPYTVDENNQLTFLYNPLEK